MPITNPAVLDQLPDTATVYTSVWHRKYGGKLTAFHIWRDCQNLLRWKTQETTIAFARANGLGLCLNCANRARDRAALRSIIRARETK